MSSILQMRIFIKGIKPPIYRILEIENSRTLHELHIAIQTAFGWAGFHRYSFTIDEQDFAVAYDGVNEKNHRQQSDTSIFNFEAGKGRGIYV